MFVRANWWLCVGVVAGGYQDGELLYAAAALAARRSTGGRRQAATAPTVGPADVRRLRAHVTTGGGSLIARSSWARYRNSLPHAMEPPFD